MSSDSHRNTIESSYQSDPALRALLCEFAQDLPSAVRNLKISLDNRDFKSGADQSHRLAGSSAVYGYDKLSQFFRRMEDMLRATSVDEHAIDEDLKTVESLIPQILSVLNVKEKT